MHDSRYPLDRNAGLFEFGSEQASADMTTLSSAEGRAASEPARTLAAFRAELDALDGFVSETKDLPVPAEPRPNLALLKAGLDDDVRRTGCASTLAAPTRSAVDEIRAQFLRRAMHVVCLAVIFALAMLFSAGALLVAMRELAPATPISAVQPHP